MNREREVLDMVVELTAKIVHDPLTGAGGRILLSVGNTASRIAIKTTAIAASSRIASLLEVSPEWKAAYQPPGSGFEPLTLSKTILRGHGSSQPSEPFANDRQLEQCSATRVRPVTNSSQSQPVLR